ncbi:MAG: hypothetical protein OZ928_05980 [Polyangiaceae bacterium]|nr:hypothetical protein [Polyangiaceae bacterium]
MKERRLAFFLLAWLAAWFLAYVAALVPHLVNSSYGDVEFTGWSGPIGARLAAGERPYVDFVLPIPPGSFAILALVAKLAGRPLLLHELWLNAACHLGMALAAYAIAVKFASRALALAVASLSLISVVVFNKECAYDHTAQVVAWGAVAALARAALAAEPGRRRAWWLATGALSGLVFAFKQSTGLGAVAGGGLALAYLGVLDRGWGEGVSGRRESARRVLRDAGAFAAGLLVGASAVALLVLSLGSSLGAFFQAVFADGPDLKGGTASLLDNLFDYVVVDTTFPATLVSLVAVVWVGSRVARFEGRLQLGDEARRGAPLDRPRVLGLAVAIAVPLAGAALLLRAPGAVLSPELVRVFDTARLLPSVGLALAAVSLVAHSRRAAEGVGEGALRSGHALGAVTLAALGISLLHNTSAPELRAFYDNNPVIPLSWLMVLVALRRARLGWALALAVAVGMSALFGNKLARALVARTPVGGHGYWAGLQVSPRGADMVRVALRVRELAGPDGTVLVLPEDVNLAALIGRPRPALRGAIVFVDQYPRRLVAGDEATLIAEPPEVIVLHPAEPAAWQRIFRIWSRDSGAEQLIGFVERRLLPGRYRLDRSLATRFLGGQATLQIWVRDGPPRR